MYTNKYKDTAVDLHGSNDNTFYMTGDNIVFISQKRDDGWTVFAVYDKEAVEDFSNISNLFKLQHVEVIEEMLEPSSEEEKVCVLKFILVQFSSTFCFRQIFNIFQHF